MQLRTRSPSVLVPGETTLYMTVFKIYYREPGTPRGGVRLHHAQVRRTTGHGPTPPPGPQTTGRTRAQPSEGYLRSSHAPKVATLTGVLNPKVTSTTARRRPDVGAPPNIDGDRHTGPVWSVSLV